MTDMENQLIDISALQSALEQRQQLIADYTARERELVEASFSEMAERVQCWEGMITELRQNAHAQQLTSYKSLARSMGPLLGASIRDQAKVMIPFEIAESTKEFARFLGTKDPSALASSLKHALSARQYASAAKVGGASGGGGAARSGGGSAGPAGHSGGSEPSRHARVIVNVGRQVGVVDTYEFARTLIDAINENVGDDVVLEVSS